MGLHGNAPTRHRTTASASAASAADASPIGPDVLGRLRVRRSRARPLAACSKSICPANQIAGLSSPNGTARSSRAANFWKTIPENQAGKLHICKAARLLAAPLTGRGNFRPAPQNRMGEACTAGPVGHFGLSSVGTTAPTIATTVATRSAVLSTQFGGGGRWPEAAGPPKWRRAGSRTVARRPRPGGCVVREASGASPLALNLFRIHCPDIDI
jgi:hypothetical protein